MVIMSTIIKLIPEAHATKRTTWVRLTGDGQVTTRVEDPVGTDTDKSFDFSSLVEGESYKVANEPFIEIEAQKIGTNARYIIMMTEFYDSSATGNDIPTERFVWYDYKTKSDDAPDSTLVQTFPINVLFSTAGTPQSPTRALSPVAQTRQSLYAQLGSTAARRQYLKGLIRFNHVDHPDFQLWLSGYKMLPEKGDLTYWNHRPAEYILWIEMVTRAISIDANLEDTTTPRVTTGEQKFNLIAGDVSLQGWELLNYVNDETLGAINSYRGNRFPRNNNRNSWRYIRWGSVGSSSPYAYTAPTPTPTESLGEWGFDKTVNNYQLFPDITLASGVTIPADQEWLDWLRS